MLSNRTHSDAQSRSDDEHQFNTVHLLATILICQYAKNNLPKECSSQSCNVDSYSLVARGLVMPVDIRYHGEGNVAGEELFAKSAAVPRL